MPRASSRSSPIACFSSAEAWARAAAVAGSAPSRSRSIASDEGQGRQPLLGPVVQVAARRGGAHGPPPRRCAAGTPGPPPAGPVSPRAAARSRSLSRLRPRRRGRVPGQARGRESASRAAARRARPAVTVRGCLSGPGRGSDPGWPLASTQRSPGRPPRRAAPATDRQGCGREMPAARPGRSGRSSSTTRSPTALRARRADSSPQTKMTGRLISSTPCSSHSRYAKESCSGSGRRTPEQVDDGDDAHGDPQRGQVTACGRRRPPEPQPHREDEQQRPGWPRLAARTTSRRRMPAVLGNGAGSHAHAGQPSARGSYTSRITTQMLMAHR